MSMSTLALYRLLLMPITIALLWLPNLAAKPRVAILDFGETATGKRAADELHESFMATGLFTLLDRALVRSAAKGIGYAGSLNMSLDEARDLGAAIGCDFFIIGDAQTLRRSPSSGTYFESYASIFIVNAQTGELLFWDRPDLQASTPSEAEKELLKELDRRAAHYASLIERAHAAKLTRAPDRSDSDEGEDFLVLPDEDAPDARHFSPPQPYRRLQPNYPEEAARAEAEATVDALVWIGTDGEVKKVKIIRWAGFGLDEAVSEIIRKMHFRPALRDGAPVNVRVLLRYNFRRRPND
jgi:TonB family protein